MFLRGPLQVLVAASVISAHWEPFEEPTDAVELGETLNVVAFLGLRRGI
jgi:hypothetical protein